MPREVESAHAPVPRPPLDEDRLRRTLVDEGAFRQVDVVAETVSTNADLLADPTGDRRVLLAEHQTSGRGRHSRSWTGVPGAQVLVSILLRLPGAEPSDLGWLPLLTGTAIVDAVRAVGGVDAELKWPNDVLVDGRKLAGILVEVVATAPVPTVVIGIGLNVTLTEDDLPVPTATSLLLAGADELDRTRIVEGMLTSLADRVDAWQHRGWDPTTAAGAYRSRCSTIGRRVRAVLPGDTELHGDAVDIDDYGRIVIRPDGDGEPVSIAAGDITHLRPL